MPRSKRHRSRSQSTSNQQEPDGFNNIADHGVPLNEPVPVSQPHDLPEPSTQQEPHVLPEPSTQQEPHILPEPSTQQEPHNQVGPSEHTRRSNKYWTVGQMDENGDIKETRLKVQDIFVLQSGQKIVLEWNREGQPIGESAGLLGGFLGHIASNFDNFPISYEKWPKIPSTYKEHVWDNTIRKKFVVFDGPNKNYIFKNLGKKWKDNRGRLFHEYYDPSLSWEANIERHPHDISRDQWASFLGYRLSNTTKEMCDVNASNRRNQIIPHTLGSKTLARKRNEIEKQTGRPCSRAEMYNIAHKKKDGSFVNDGAKVKSEELRVQSQTYSEEEAYINVFGKEHSGHVRGMGFGVCPSQIFGSSSRSGGGSSGGGPSQAEYDALLSRMQEMENTLSMLVKRSEPQVSSISPNISQDNDVGSQAQQ